GPTNVDVSYATRREIPVLFTPGRNAHGVADLTIGLMIAEGRGIARADAEMKSGVFGVPELGVELWRKTLGVVGLGNVGSAVAYRAKNGFNMKVLAYDPYVSKERAEEIGAKLVELETLLRESDFVTIHSRAEPDAKPQITAEHIALMKPTAYLVNTSRGNILDEQALVKALKDGNIAGAALDVYSKEPVEEDNPLLSLDNVTLTPHIGGVTREVPMRAAEIMAEDVARFLKGEKPRNILNPEVLNHQEVRQ
ncbi:MAG: NAD(P)-dependent oxidoreductase, partial [Nitrososphaeria archaeon]